MTSILERRREDITLGPSSDLLTVEGRNLSARG